MKKTKLIIVLFLIITISILFQSKSFAWERISWNGKMRNGRSIYYYLAPGNEYTVGIPRAVQRLMYPPNMTNPMRLTRTYNWQNSKMDFYQYSDSNSNVLAYTQLYPPYSQSQDPYYVSQLDYVDWQYAKISLNDPVLMTYSVDKIRGIILHEICHGYGGRDVYDNRDCIMYGASDGNTTQLCSMFNQVLINKYGN